jgi:hypothetical protein
VISRFRHLLLCLLMLALPLQGFAAAAMLYCGVGASSHSHSETTDGHHHAAAGALESGHDHSMGSQAADVTADAPGVQKQLPDGSHKCGVCSACCSGVAISGSPLAVEVQSPPKADLVEPFVLIYAVPSRLPEKPPRA